MSTRQRREATAKAVCSQADRCELVRWGRGCTGPAAPTVPLPRGQPKAALLPATHFTLRARYAHHLSEHPPKQRSSPGGQRAAADGQHILELLRQLGCQLGTQELVTGHAAQHGRTLSAHSPLPALQVALQVGRQPAGRAGGWAGRQLSGGRAGILGGSAAPKTDMSGRQWPGGRIGGSGQMDGEQPAVGVQDWWAGGAACCCFPPAAKASASVHHCPAQQRQPQAARPLLPCKHTQSNPRAPVERLQHAQHAQHIPRLLRGRQVPHRALRPHKLREGRGRHVIVVLPRLHVQSRGRARAAC